MSETPTIAAAATERSPKPHYWDWWRWLINTWEAPGGLDKAYVVALLGALNISADDGRALYPKNETIMRQLKKSRSWVQRYRQACMRQGLVREVAPKRWVDGVLVLEICFPASRGSSGATLGVARETPITKEITNSNEELIGSSGATLLRPLGSDEPINSGVARELPQRSEHFAHVKAFMAATGKKDKSACWREHKNCAECVADVMATDDVWTKKDIAEYQAEQDAA